MLKGRLSLRTTDKKLALYINRDNLDNYTNYKILKVTEDKIFIELNKNKDDRAIIFSLGKGKVPLPGNNAIINIHIPDVFGKDINDKKYMISKIDCDIQHIPETANKKCELIITIPEIINSTLKSIPTIDKIIKPEFEEWQTNSETTNNTFDIFENLTEDFVTSNDQVIILTRNDLLRYYEFFANNPNVESLKIKL